MGSILPFGGHKGYGLGLVAEILAGALTGGGCSASGKKQLEQGMLSIYIDPARLGEPSLMMSEVRRFVDFVHTSRPVDPERPVLIPGELEEQTRATRRQGLELDETTWNQIVEAAQSYDVPDDLIDAAVIA